MITVWYLVKANWIAFVENFILQNDEDLRVRRGSLKDLPQLSNFVTL